MKKLLPAIAALAATLSSHAYAQSCDMSSEQQVGVVEIVQFRLAEGVSGADFKAAAASTMPFLCGTDGFIRRTLSRGEDGLWITELDTITPHPVYGWMSWVSVLNPSAQTLEGMDDLIEAAFLKAKTAFDKKTKATR